MVEASGETPTVQVPFGSWYDEARLRLDFPPGWRVEVCPPQGAPEISDSEIESALASPHGAAGLRELCRGRERAVVAVDDLTRPTPAHRILPPLLRQLEAAGLGPERVKILVGTASHRPPSASELERKIGAEVIARYEVLIHDFFDPSIRRVGWIAGGPVDLNAHYLDADLRICVGGVIPHNETGFGGGAKMLVPGLAGHATIAHFHGALPPRRAGQIEAAAGLDRRSWSERVAREVGLDWVVCAVVNAERQLAGLFAGDPVEAWRAAAKQAGAVGRTRLSAEQARADVVVVDAYPLDTDPIQSGKSMNLAGKLNPRCTVLVSAASDGIFYHGMGMGSGFEPRRLLRGLPGVLASPRRLSTFARSLLRGFPRPELVARLAYFTLSARPYPAFAAAEGRWPGARGLREPPPNADPLLFSRDFPAWGFRQKFPHGGLYREWDALRADLAVRFPDAHALVFPCAPIQLIEVDSGLDGGASA